MIIIHVCFSPHCWHCNALFTQFFKWKCMFFLFMFLNSVAFTWQHSENDVCLHGNCRNGEDDVVSMLSGTFVSGHSYGKLACRSHAQGLSNFETFHPCKSFPKMCIFSGFEHCCHVSRHAKHNESFFFNFHCYYISCKPVSYSASKNHYAVAILL